MGWTNRRPEQRSWRKAGERRGAWGSRGATGAVGQGGREGGWTGGPRNRWRGPAVLRVHFPLIVGVALALGFLLASLLAPESGIFVRSGLSIGLVLAGLGTFVEDVAYGPKKVSPLVQPRRIGVTIGLRGAEVKRVRRQVLGKEPVAADELPVLRGAAVQIREGLARQLLTSPGFVMFLFGQAVGRGITSVMDVLFIVALLGMVVLLGNIARQFHQTGVFLTTTAVSAPDDLT